MSNISAENIKPVSAIGAAGLSLSALGVVFGDIGTSPLYTLKTVLSLTGAILCGHDAWRVVPYPLDIVRCNNDQICQLRDALRQRRRRRHYCTSGATWSEKQHRPAIVAAGLFGAALIYGDGTITPAISVLSALEGMEQIAPSLQPYVLPASVAVLFALFVVQPLGTGKIGRAFGPVMLVWFACIAALGVYGITRHPGVVVAINPLYGVKFLANGGAKGFLVLGGVFCA